MFMALRRNLKTISNCISAKQIKLDFYFENVNRLICLREASSRSLNI